MPTEKLTKMEHGPKRSSLPATVRTEESELRAAARDYAKRVRRFKINLFAWVVGAILLVGVWGLVVGIMGSACSSSGR